MANTPPDPKAPGLAEERTPHEIVRELDKFIVGQNDAKRVVAIALRNRTRRRKLAEGLREEVNPKNIIMIGPTGVGKTEIARRLARLAGAPLVKVEATKYTEVGYVGRDVESMVRDLVETAVGLVREEMTESIRPEVERRTRERLIDLLDGTAGGPRRFISGYGQQSEAVLEGEEDEAADGRQRREKIADLLDAGRLEQREVEFEVAAKPGFEGMMGMVGMDEQMMGSMRDMMEKIMPQQKSRTKLRVAEARRVIEDELLEEMLDKEKIKREALERAEQGGIIFIDEIDKVAGRTGGQGPDVSREGVQRDILPIVEGSTVFTKHGNIKTDHILFIAAGAFHASKPSDLIPELQGRFPLRVELGSLTTEDFKRILVEPEHSLIKQYKALLATDGVALEFTPEALDALAEAATAINAQAENIGARRLHSILERVLDPISYDAPDEVQGPYEVTAEFVRVRLADVMGNEDLSRFIL